MAFQSAHSNVYAASLQSIAPCYAILILSSSPDKGISRFKFPQDRQGSSECGGDTFSFRCDPIDYISLGGSSQNLYGSSPSRAGSKRPPTPLPVPDGYRVVKIDLKFLEDWLRKLTLDVSCNFCYEPKPTKDFRLECPLPRCAKVIQGCAIREHLTADHVGFSRDGRYGKVACIECKTEEMEVRYFVDHVFETHCDVSTRCCAYCGEQLARGSNSVTQHHITSCGVLIPYRLSLDLDQ
ncbi:hypothetical protein EDD85DRAFT_117694 [Armillaria nabsnona]|nr:hypothetical protein EDD85DRAFT_117694 [Armillaria nabsnona]